VNAAPPGYDGPVPYGFGVVQFDEGVRVITRITATDPDRLRWGQPGSMVEEHVGSEPVRAWAFRPEAEVGGDG
jgi:uncharacterized OB-fold protein